MNFRSSLVPALLAALLAAGSVYGQAANTSQNVTVSEKLQIPGASLKPGAYTFSVEDRLQDRAIVRITSQDESKHYLILTVPSANLGQASSDGLVFFTNASAKDRALRGWACADCSPGLEFVYPKAEAAKLTDETGEPVLAVDPSYDKLPANLSPDDMKVVTLWLLSPERIIAGNTPGKKGKGVNAEKYAGIPRQATGVQTASANGPEAQQSSSATEQAAVAPAVSSAPAPSNSPAATVPVAPTAASPGAQPTEAASAPTMPAAPAPAENRPARLPKTAGSDYLYLFGGMLLMLAALGVRLSRRSAVPRS